MQVHLKNVISHATATTTDSRGTTTDFNCESSAANKGRAKPYPARRCSTFIHFISKPRLRSQEWGNIHLTCKTGEQL